MVSLCIVSGVMKLINTNKAVLLWTLRFTKVHQCSCLIQTSTGRHLCHFRPSFWAVKIHVAHRPENAVSAHFTYQARAYKLKRKNSPPWHTCSNDFFLLPCRSREQQRGQGAGGEGGETEAGSKLEWERRRGEEGN
jgi:hypothetical protein